MLNLNSLYDFLTDEEISENRIDYWRNKIFYSLLNIFLLFGTAAYILSIIVSISIQAYSIIIFDSLAYMVYLYVFLAKNKSFRFRTTVLLILLYFLGIGLLILLGNDGAGFLWLFAIPIISSILLDKKTTLFFLFVNTGSLVILGAVFHYGVLDSITNNNTSTESFIAVSVNFICLSIIAVIPLIVIVTRLENSVNHELKIKKELVEQNHHLLKTNAELDHFVYSVSHDLRSPLASSLGLLNVCKITESHQEKDQYLDLIKKSLMRLDNFIKDVVAYSKNSRTDLIKEKIDFQYIIEETKNSLSYLPEYEKIKFKTSIDEKIPYYSDPNRIKIIFNNLISNAIRYSSNNCRPPFININIACKQKGAQLVIEDNGIGIAPEHLAKVFEMFYRGTDRKPGSGLGLYILQETVKKLDGNITLKSEVDVGSVFTIDLPS